MFLTVYFYDLCEHQNHCPKSKNYHFGKTGTECLSLNGNRRVNPVIQFKKKRRDSILPFFGKTTIPIHYHSKILHIGPVFHTDYAGDFRLTKKFCKKTVIT